MNNRILQHLMVLCFIIIAMPCFSQLTINEFMADNESTITDENGDYEDWIEIYNSGSAAIDIGGYYISDDATEPTIWQIPASNAALTTIPAGGFLLLWADKDTEDGVLHVDIKLGSGGEDIVLVAADGITIIDQLSFGPQNTDVSLGRVENGGSQFQFFASSTPGASNESEPVIQTFTVNINAEVSTVNDDAIEYGTSGADVNIDSYGMLMTETWNTQTIGVRFSDIPLPTGAIITNAKIQFTSRKPSNSTGPSNLTIKGQTTNADIFIEQSNNISDRPMTSTSVNWQPDEWLTADEAGPKQLTPNLATVVQEIMDTGSWESGDALAFIITGTGQRSANNFTSGFSTSITIEAEIPVPTTPITNVYINEITPNGTEYTDEFGGYEDWIEIHNDNNFPVSLGGLYLTDKANDLTKWQIASLESIPANGFITFYADEEPELGGLHADFKLSDEGETVALVQVIGNDLVVIDSFTYGEIPFKASIGRTTETANEWVLYGAPTPLAPNAGAPAWLDKPDIDLDHGVFTIEQTINITHDDPEAIIRYTTDSSDPDENSNIYAGPLTVSETQSIRARAFKDGHAPSQIRTRNYLFDASSTLPVVMITTDPDNLYDDEIGIYTIGTNGIELGNCSNNVVANFWQDWERPATISFFETDGEEAFSVDAGIKISGNCSRRYALKSLNIYLRNNQYGDKDIDYEMFPNRDFKKYKRLRLRNSGQDFRGTMMRDGLNHRILSEVTEVEYQNYRPTLVYINGEYFGIQNFRDLYGGDYFDGFFDVKEEDLDLIKSPRVGNEVKEGDDIHYNNLYNFVEQNDLSDPQNYEYFTTQFDINSLMDYWATMIYMASSDWPANNIQVWRPRTDDGKWRYMYIDTDATTNLYSLNSPTAPPFDTYINVLDGNQQGYPNDSRSTLFIRSLLENQFFRDEYIQRSCSFMELVYNEERANTFIDEAVTTINDEIGEHVEHWAFNNPFLEDYGDWASNVDNYRNFFAQRPDFYYHHLASNFDLNDTYELSFNYDESTNGDVFVNWNKMTVPYNYTGTYFEGIPIRITAEAKEGYVFSHWLETGDTNPVIEFIANNNAVLTPIFELFGDVCNPDSPDFQDEDGDGICDVEDECPGFDDTVDINNNNIPDGCEPCFGDGDDDNDGVCNSEDQCPGFDDNVDTNNNNIPDGCEDCLEGDDDNDGVCNDDDQCPGFDDSIDANNNNIPDGCEPCFGVGDDDNDGVCNNEDQCPGFDDNIDNNNNGIPDACESCTDSDNDGFCIDEDCDDSNPDIPASPGSACDDGNPATTGDMVLADGCTCMGSTNPPTENCEAEGAAPWHEWIEIVQLSEINNTSGKSSYSDFTELSATLNTGDSYDINLTTGFSWATYDEYWRVWIDYNQDGILEPSEIAYSGILTGIPNGTDTGTLNGSINVPADASSGVTLMRVSMSRGAYAPPCGSFPNGEVEDYSIIINQGDGSILTLSNCSDDITETANIGQNNVTVSWPTPTAITTCDPNTINLSQVVGPPSGSSFTVGTTTVISYTATDLCGNEQTCSFNVTIEAPDNGSVNISCGPDINVSAEAGQAGTIVVWNPATATSSCPLGGLNINQNEGPDTGSFLPIGSYQVEYTATDACENQASCSFNITVEAPDNGSIDINCSSNITVFADAGQTGAVVSWDAATASTTCPTNGLDLSQNEGQASGSFFNIGSYQIVYVATDACGNQEFCGFTVFVLEGNTNGEYCESEGDFPWHEWINNVQLNTINNTSGKASYSDFTDISTSLTAGAQYDLNLTTEYSWTTHDEHWKVWIDYNQDGTFAEPSELAYSGVLSAPPNGTETAILNGSLIVPVSALPGSTRMRVSMNRGAAPTACGVNPFGETEDYTVVIGGGSNQSFTALENNIHVNTGKSVDPHNTTSTSIRIFPNPTKGVFYIDAENFEGLATSVSVYNHLGQLIKFSETTALASDDIRMDLSNQPNGFYFIAVKAEGKAMATEKIMITK